MRHARAGHMLRWFLLLWLGLIYVWGLQLLGLLLIGGSGVPGGGVIIFPGGPSSHTPPYPPTNTSGLHCAPFSSSLFTVFLFTGLMICHVGLYWFGLSGKMPLRWRFPYLAAQGLLVGMMSFCLVLGRCGAGIYTPPEDFLICLYLALIVGAISILDRANAIIVVVAGYILLLVLNTVLLESRTSLLVSLQTSAQSLIWYTAMILFIIGYSIVYLQQVRTYSQLQVTHARLQASTAKIEELTRAYERQRLARDLHDTLAQGLAGVTMQLEAANTHLAHHQITTAQAIVQQAILCAREALIDARSAIDDLRAPQTVTAEIAVALQKEIDHFVVESGIPCDVDIPQNLSVSPALHEHMLGIVREGLTNIIRHAQAHHVHIALVPRDRMLALEIDDDGVGFDPASPPQSGHYGLIGMHERARLLGGYFGIRSAPGMGTSLQLSLPSGQEYGENWNESQRTTKQR